MSTYAQPFAHPVGCDPYVCDAYTFLPGGGQHRFAASPDVPTVRSPADLPGSSGSSGLATKVPFPSGLGGVPVPGVPAVVAAGEERSLAATTLDGRRALSCPANGRAPAWTPARPAAARAGHTAARAAVTQT